MTIFRLKLIVTLFLSREDNINYLIPFLGNSISYLQKKRDMRMLSTKELLEADDKDGDNTD